MWPGKRRRQEAAQIWRLEIRIDLVIDGLAISILLGNGWSA